MLLPKNPIIIIMRHKSYILITTYFFEARNVCYRHRAGIWNTKALLSKEFLSNKSPFNTEDD